MAPNRAWMLEPGWIAHEMTAENSFEFNHLQRHDNTMTGAMPQRPHAGWLVDFLPRKYGVLRGV